jgi:hypothetical protein
MSELKRPDLKIALVGEDGETVEVKMTYGLFNDLQRTVPDAGNIVSIISSDPFTRDYLLRRCLTPVRKIITDDSELIPAEDVTIDNPDEIDKLMQWVAGHLLYFFATSAGGLRQLGEAFKGKLQLPDQPAPSSNGSKA